MPPPFAIERDRTGAAAPGLAARYPQLMSRMNRLAAFPFSNYRRAVAQDEFAEMDFLFKNRYLVAAKSNIECDRCAHKIIARHVPPRAVSEMNRLKVAFSVCNDRSRALRSAVRYSLAAPVASP